LTQNGNLFLPKHKHDIVKEYRRSELTLLVVAAGAVSVMVLVVVEIYGYFYLITNIFYLIWGLFMRNKKYKQNIRRTT
jgi:hypothetical protein